MKILTLIEIKFSTLGHYFDDVRNELLETGSLVDNEGDHGKGTTTLSKLILPSYQGDFFTYCDENEDYWSGYFTTRPFMKGLTRSTQAILRTGEILATLARSYGGENLNQEQWGTWFDSIQTARRNVALFQHHDGVTGTARRAVVEDYASRLLTSLAQVAEYSSGMTIRIHLCALS
jgi:alpha-mannosidase II